MKLQELTPQQPAKNAAKVMESYFGQSINVERLATDQARAMLKKVQGLLREHRTQSSIHNSERNPAYLKLVVLEQALQSRCREDMAQPNTMSGAAKIAGQVGTSAGQLNKAVADTTQGKTLSGAAKDAGAALGAKVTDLLKNPQAAQALKTLLQKYGTQATAESRKNLRTRLKEASEVQQAQVVLAAQDLVDRIQKMLEDTSEMQFKDLPALVDSMKNDIGTEQATQFNTTVGSTLGTLVQNLQQAKQGMDEAIGVVTGQDSITVPGADADVGADAGAELDADLSLDANLPAEPEDEEDAVELKDLGRERR